MMTIYENILKKIEAYKYVSFDIFDTLMFRTVKNPEDIFNLVQYKYNLSERKSIKNFRKKRIEAEQKAREKSNWTEVTINDIYLNLDLETKAKEYLMKLEKQMEVDTCLPNPLMIKILNECQKRGQQIIIITDMYLDRDTICKILKKIHVRYDELFISCEYKVTKNSGKLYQVVLKELKVQASELIHIGDNPINDIQRARENDIASIERIINSPKKLLYYKNKPKSILQDQFKNTISLCMNDCLINKQEYHIGIEVISPIIYNFCLWIHDCKVKLALTKLFFLAREGYLIYKCYKEIFPNDEAEYIALNRNLLRAPLMNLDNISGYLLNNIPEKNEYTMQELFVYLSLDRLIDLKEIDESILNSIISRQELQDGKQEEFFKKFISVLKEYKEEQEGFLLEYLKECKLLEGKVGLVNNSINGTGQCLLEEYLKKYGEKTEIIGLQFVKSEKCVRRLKSRCKAWLSDAKSRKRYEFDFERMSLIFEHLLFEEKGTALYLYHDKSGKVCVYNENQRKEKENHEVLGLIQYGILKGVKYLATAHVIESKDWELENYIKFVNYPDVKSAKLLCDLYDDDADGDYKIADSKIEYSFKIILGKNISNNIKWPEGFLKIKGKKNNILVLYHIRIWIRRVKKIWR